MEKLSLKFKGSVKGLFKFLGIKEKKYEECFNCGRICEHYLCSKCDGQIT